MDYKPVGGCLKCGGAMVAVRDEGYEADAPAERDCRRVALPRGGGDESWNGDFRFTSRPAPLDRNIPAATLGNGPATMVAVVERLRCINCSGRVG